MTQRELDAIDMMMGDNLTITIWGTELVKYLTEPHLISKLIFERDYTNELYKEKAFILYVHALDSSMVYNYYLQKDTTLGDTDIVRSILRAAYDWYSANYIIDIKSYNHDMD
jgi:hypothetical protein